MEEDVMLEVNGNIWDYYDKGAWIVVPTNGSVRKDGAAVMGRGIAKQLADKCPYFPQSLGTALKNVGNRVLIWPAERVVTMPVKHKWNEKADIKLIERSLKELVSVTGTIPLYIPHVGCGNGKLDWDKVKPLMEELLDDRFIVVAYTRKS
jgi:hypothetical protein